MRILLSGIALASFVLTALAPIGGATAPAPVPKTISVIYTGDSMGYPTPCG